MISRIFFLFFLFISINCYPIFYGLDAKAQKNCKITKFQFFSERCSGSNFIKNLLCSNFIVEKKVRNYGHKHFPPWFSLPMEFYPGPEHFYTFKDSENVLFIVIFRNPYDWLSSFNLKPWNGSKKLKNLDLSSFIRKKWSLNPNHPRFLATPNPLEDRNPVDGSLFSNVMKLRTAKIETMLEIKNRVKNIYFINYEVIKEHPQEVLKEIECLFNLKRVGKYRSCNLL